MSFCAPVEREAVVHRGLEHAGLPVQPLALLRAEAVEVPSVGFAERCALPGRHRGQFACV